MFKKKSKGIISFVLSMAMCLSMCMSVYASEETYVPDVDDSHTIAETEIVVSMMPRYSAVLDFDEISPGYVSYGINQFNLSAGSKITCNFQSTGKFSLALFNRDIGEPWVSDIIHDSSCSSEITVPIDGNYSIGVYNRDTKAIKVTGSYSL